MRLELDFAGWFQVRLATNPDPHDEPRGVSGYTWTLPGEPDFDRVIRFQPLGATERVGCAPEVSIGVTVRQVRVDDAAVESHPLVGVPVDFADQPVFEGRNGIVAGNGVEPVVPLRIQIGVPPFGRAYSDEDAFPYTELRATGIEWSQESRAAVRAATGIDDLGEVWRIRKARLAAIAASTQDEILRAGCRWRIDYMDAHTDLVGDFTIRMNYAMALRGAIEGAPPEAGLSAEDWTAPWSLSFWMGGWDFDSLCAFVSGTLTIGERGSQGHRLRHTPPVSSSFACPPQTQQQEGPEE